MNVCKFRHFKVNELVEILNEVEDLRQENKSLKTILLEKSLKSGIFSENNNYVTNEYVHALENQQKFIFSKENKQPNDLKIKQTNNHKHTWNSASNCSNEPLIVRFEHKMKRYETE